MVVEAIAGAVVSDQTAVGKGAAGGVETAERAVEFIAPGGIDDPARPSGGNTYDRRLCQGLAEAGWTVREHHLDGAWPTPSEADRDGLARVLDTVPDASIVVIDGLIASAAPDQLRRAARPCRLVVLVHLPLGAVTADDRVAARERAALAAADLLIVTSGWTREWLRGHCLIPAERIVVAAPGVPATALARPSATGDRLLFVGGLAWHKGVDVLVEALARIADRCWSCRLVGPEIEPGLVAHLDARLAAASLAERAVRLGPLTPAQLDAVYAESDLLVVPSRTETYGMVVLEALARGIPVLTSDAGGLPEALGLGAHGVVPGLLIPAGDPGRLGDALARWLADPVLRGRLQAAARARRGALLPWTATADRVGEALAGLPPPHRLRA